MIPGFRFSLLYIFYVSNDNLYRFVFCLNACYNMAFYQKCGIFFKAIPFLVATADPVCNSQKIMTNASCNFDKGSCGYTIPMYPHLWEITRYYYGDDTVGIVEGDHTTRSIWFYCAISRDPWKKTKQKKKQTKKKQKTKNKKTTSRENEYGFEKNLSFKMLPFMYF